MRGAGGGGADAAGVGALTPSMKVYVAPFIQLLQYSTTYCILYCIYTGTVNGATVQYSTSTVLLYCTVHIVQYSTVLSTVQYSTVYTYNTVLYCTVLYTVLYSTVLYTVR